MRGEDLELILWLCKEGVCLFSPPLPSACDHKAMKREPEKPNGILQGCFKASAWQVVMSHNEQKCQFQLKKAAFKTGNRKVVRAIQSKLKVKIKEDKEKLQQITMKDVLVLSNKGIKTG